MRVTIGEHENGKSTRKLFRSAREYSDFSEAVAIAVNCSSDGKLFKMEMCRVIRFGQSLTRFSFRPQNMRPSKVRMPMRYTQWSLTFVLFVCVRFST